PGPSHSALGAWRSDETRESHDALSTTPSCGSRRGLSGGATRRWRAVLSATGWASAGGRAGTGRSRSECDRRGARAERCARRPHPYARVDARVAGRAFGRGLGDQRFAPVRDREPLSVPRLPARAPPTLARVTSAPPRPSAPTLDEP